MVWAGCMHEKVKSESKIDSREIKRRKCIFPSSEINFSFTVRYNIFPSRQNFSFPNFTDLFKTESMRSFLYSGVQFHLADGIVSRIENCHELENSYSFTRSRIIPVPIQQPVSELFKMRVAVISDIHAHLEPFKQVLADIGR